MAQISLCYTGDICWWDQFIVAFHGICSIFDLVQLKSCKANIDGESRSSSPMFVLTHLHTKIKLKQYVISDDQYQS